MLSKTEREQFYSWTMSFFKNNRAAQSKEVFEKLKEEMPRMAKKIEKAGKKIGALAYIGRHLLPSFAKEGWLKNKDKVWSVEITPDRCPYCLQQIDEVYIIDIENNRYCNADCMEECEGAEPPYDSYWDDYIALFYEFESIYHQYRGTLEDYETITNNGQDSRKIIFTHIYAIKLIDHIEEILPDFEYILFNGGDDGSLATEMNRMVESIQAKLEHLRTMADNIGKLRNPQIKFYSIIIDPAYLNGPGKKDLELKKFMKKYRKYRNPAEPNIWTTDNSDLSHNWWDLLGYLKEALDYVNTVECPLCGKVETEKIRGRSIDEYRYCEDCYYDYELGVK